MWVQLLGKHRFLKIWEGKKPEKNRRGFGQLETLKLWLRIRPISESWNRSRYRQAVNATLSTATIPPAWDKENSFWCH